MNGIDSKKVLLVNGGPHERGCTYTALKEVAGALERGGIETEILWLGNGAVRGCIACGACRRTGRCAFGDDPVNAVLEKLDGLSGLVVGSPVYYASASGQITSFLDRLFYAASGKLAYKPAAAVVSCRRGGATAAFDQLNKYFSINCMPIVSSQYWNQIHGNTPEEALRDEEGLQIRRALGDNMAWLIKCIAAGGEAGIPTPVREPWKPTNFIR